jgi:hypothetical protein
LLDKAISVDLRTTVNIGFGTQAWNFELVKIDFQHLQVSRFLEFNFNLFALRKTHQFADGILFEDVEDLLVTEFVHLVAFLDRNEALPGDFNYFNQSFFFSLAGRPGEASLHASDFGVIE